MGFLIMCLFWCAVWAGVAVLIGQHKNIPTGECLVWGGLLGLIGVIVVACSKPRSALPPAPPGMWAVKCWRCGAGQNVPYGQDGFSCYRCGAAQQREVA